MTVRVGFGFDFQLERFLVEKKMKKISYSLRMDWRVSWRRFPESSSWPGSIDPPDPSRPLHRNSSGDRPTRCRSPRPKSEWLRERRFQQSGLRSLYCSASFRAASVYSCFFSAVRLFQCSPSKQLIALPSKKKRKKKPIRNNLTTKKMKKN